MEHAATRTYRMTLAYDGTDFFGWQVQPGLDTVQGTLAAAVLQVTGERTLPQGSGRTDTGVHAQGQVVSLVLSACVPPDRLQRALNRRLPPSIRIVELACAPDTFHARSCVLNKTYEYRIFERRRTDGADENICSPHLARFVWDCRWPLHHAAMQAAAETLVGTHDFTSFAATDPDRTTRETNAVPHSTTPPGNTRTVFAARWQRFDGLLVFRITGSGFLHHMVRNIVGTCVEAGTGRRPPQSLQQILEARDRRAAGIAAPPQGLHLMHVQYRQDICDTAFAASSTEAVPA